MLGRFGATLRSAAVWEEPPDDLGERVFAQVEALRDATATSATAPTSARRSAPASLDAGRRRRRTSRGWGPGWRSRLPPWSPSPPGPCSPATTTAAVAEPIADVELTPTALGAGATRRGRRRRRRCGVLHQHRRRRAPGGGGGRVLRGLVARRADGRLGQRRHVPHAQRRRPRRAVGGRADRPIRRAGRHRRGRGFHRRPR